MKCAHCQSTDTHDIPSMEGIYDCGACGRGFRAAGLPPEVHPNLLMRTREGIEVIGTLEAFSLHYLPAWDSIYVEGEDCVNALFIPDEPSWDCVWAELENAVDPEMLTRYPYTPEPFGTGPSVKG